MHIATNLFLAESVAPLADPEVLLGSMLPGLVERYRLQGGDVTYASLTQHDQYLIGIELGRYIEVRLDQNQDLVDEEARFAATLAGTGQLSVEQIMVCAPMGMDIILDGAVADSAEGATSINYFRANAEEATQPLMDLGQTSLKEFIDNYFDSRKWQKYRVGMQIANLVYKQLRDGERSDLAFDFDTVAELTPAFHHERLNMNRHWRRKLEPTIQALIHDPLPFSA